MVKITQEEAEKRFEDAGYILVDEYKDVFSPLKSIGADGYLYSKSLHDLKNINAGKLNYLRPFNKGNLYCWDNILKYMDDNVDNGTELLSEKSDMKSADSKLLFKCGMCGATFNKTWRQFRQAKLKICQHCLKNERPQTKQRSDATFEKCKAVAQENNLKIMSDTVYSWHDKILLEDSEGYKGVVVVNNFIYGSTFEKFSIKHNPYALDNLQLLIDKSGRDSKVLSYKEECGEYKIKIKCECGEEFEVGLFHALRKHLCNKCTKSKSILEDTVERWLQLNGVKYEAQKAFTGLVGVGKKSLRYDFYVPDKNCCIEVNGAQHYKPATFGIRSKEDAEQAYKITQIHDKRKEEFCRDNNINFVVIPFWEIEKTEGYKTILSEALL